MTPNFLKQLHKKSMVNREDVAASAWSGCFYCLRVFPSGAVVDYVDRETTALCPHCHIDSVLAEASLDRPLTCELLEAMHEEFFVVQGPAGPSTAARKVLGLDPRPDVPQFQPLQALAAKGLLPAPVVQDGTADWSSLDPPSLLPTSRLLWQLRSGFPWPSVVIALLLAALAAAQAAGWAPRVLGMGALETGAIALLQFCHGLAWFLPMAPETLGALRAMKSGRWADPRIHRSLGLPRSWDLSFPRNGDALLAEARDWARAGIQAAPGRAWAAWLPHMQDVRNHDLRRFVRLARKQAGSGGPYGPGEPL